MELSLYLAKVLGIFYLFGGLGMLMNHKTYMKIEKLWLKDKSMALLFGMILMPAGLFLVVGHNIWEFSYLGLITLIGWIVFIKGALIVVFPDLLEVLRKKTFGDAWLYIGAVIWFIMGLYLTYMGFFA